MVVLGGGTTKELHVDDRETWVYRLGNHFRENGQAFTIVNAGVESQTAIGHITMLKKWFPLLPGAKPRYVAAYVGINDMMLGPDDDKQWVDDLTPRKRTKKLRFYIKNHSAFFRLYRLVKGWIKAKAVVAGPGSRTYDDVKWVPAGPVPSPLYQDKDAVDDVLLKRYSRRLVILIDAIRGLGAEPVIITQGTNGYRVRQGVLYGVTGSDRPDTGLYETIAAYNGGHGDLPREKGNLRRPVRGVVFRGWGFLRHGAHHATGLGEDCRISVRQASVPRCALKAARPGIRSS